MAAETTGEYSLQDVAWWIRELEIPSCERIRWLNAMAEPEYRRRPHGASAGTPTAEGLPGQPNPSWPCGSATAGRWTSTSR